MDGWDEMGCLDGWTSHLNHRPCQYIHANSRRRSSRVQIFTISAMCVFDDRHDDHVVVVVVAVVAVDNEDGGDYDQDLII